MVGMGPNVPSITNCPRSFDFLTQSIESDFKLRPFKSELTKNNGEDPSENIIEKSTLA